VNSVKVNRNPANAVKAGDAVLLNYGQVRVQGKLLWQDPGITDPATGDFYYLLGYGEIGGIVAVWPNGYQVVSGVMGVTLSGASGTPTQAVSTPPFAGRMPSMAWLKVSFYSADPHGFAWVVPAGSMPPDVSVDIHGLKVYDPRTATTVYSANAALVIRDFLTHTVHGCGISTALFSDTDWSNYANQCDTLGFTINMSISQQTSALLILEQMRQACNGTIYQEDGLYKLFVDRVQSAVVVAFDTTVNCHSVDYAPVLATDTPTRVTIQFANATAAFASDSATVEAPGVALGAEAVYQSQSITSMVQAYAVASYTVNVATYGLRVTFVASFVAVNLKRGALITLTTDEGLSVQKFLVTDIQRLDTGEYTVTARVYLNAIYSSSAITGDTPLASVLPNPFAVPPDITSASLGTYSVVASATPMLVTQNDFASVIYSPPVSAFAKELRVRIAVGAGAPSATWASMAGTEIVVPILGNLPPSGSSSVLETTALVGGTTVKNYTSLGGLLTTVTTVLAARVIVKTMSSAGILSAGVTLNRSASSTTTTAYSPSAILYAQTAAPGILMIERPRTGTHSAGLYGAAYWAAFGSYSGLTAANMNDGSTATTGVTLLAGTTSYARFDAGLGNAVAFGKVTAIVSGDASADPNRRFTYFSDDGIAWFLATVFAGSSWTYSSPNTTVVNVLYGFGPHRFWAFGTLPVFSYGTTTTSAPVLEIQFEVVDYLSEPNLDYYEVGYLTYDVNGHAIQNPLKTQPAFVRGIPSEVFSVSEIMGFLVRNSHTDIVHNVHLTIDMFTAYVDVVDGSGGRVSGGGQTIYPYYTTP
jgi:hypothetical protein